MDNRPIIGITTQTLDAIPDQLPRCWVMSQRYVQMLVTVGAVPWVIPLLEGDEATLRGIYEQIDGLFLPGGVDVDPSAYGEARGPHCKCGPRASPYALGSTSTPPGRNRPSICS